MLWSVVDCLYGFRSNFDRAHKCSVIGRATLCIKLEVDWTHVNLDAYAPLGAWSSIYPKESNFHYLDLNYFLIIRWVPIDNLGTYLCIKKNKKSKSWLFSWGSHMYPKSTPHNLCKLARGGGPRAHGKSEVKYTSCFHPKFNSTHDVLTPLSKLFILNHSRRF
jgi:hypothetical protein